MLEQVLQHGSQEMSLREKISRAAEAFIHLKAQNLPLQFFISTLNGLGDLFEDEIIPTPIPMKVSGLDTRRSIKIVTSNFAPQVDTVFENLSNDSKRNNKNKVQLNFHFQSIYAIKHCIHVFIVFEFLVLNGCKVGIERKIFILSILTF